jgi:hypothetical protein
MQDFIEQQIKELQKQAYGYFNSETKEVWEIKASDVRKSLQTLQARMIQEFKSMIPEEVDYLTHMENKTAYDRGNGFNECRSIILNNLKK